jgi:hypothetical protein
MVPSVSRGLLSAEIRLQSQVVHVEFFVVEMTVGQVSCENFKFFCHCYDIDIRYTFTYVTDAI